MQHVADLDVVFGFNLRDPASDSNDPARASAAVLILPVREHVMRKQFSALKIFNAGTRYPGFPPAERAGTVYLEVPIDTLRYHEVP